MNETLRTVLKEMFKRVGLKNKDFDKAFKTGAFKKDNWYMIHEWTIAEQKKFEKWLVDYLYNSKKAREQLCELPWKNRRHLKRVAQMFVFQYGWKLKE